MAKVKLTDERIKRAKVYLGNALDGLLQPKRWVSGAYVLDKKTGKTFYPGYSSGANSPNVEPQYCAMGALYFEGPKNWGDPALRAATVLLARQLPESWLRRKYDAAVYFAKCDKKKPPAFEDWLIDHTADYDTAHGMIAEFNDGQRDKRPVVNLFKRTVAELKEAENEGL